MTTPDGKALVYIVREGGKNNLWLQPLDGRPGKQITNFSADFVEGTNRFAFSPDGKSLGVLRTRVESDAVILRDTR